MSFLVISLKRTPERLSNFFKMNEDALADWEVDVINGIDGAEQEQSTNNLDLPKCDKQLDQGSNRLGPDHIKAWRRCIELNKRYSLQRMMQFSPKI